MAKPNKRLESNNKSDNKYLWYAFFTLLAIIIIGIVGANSINFNISVEDFPISRDDFTSQEGGRIKLRTVIIENNYFLPRTYDVGKYQACVYSSNNKQFEYLDITLGDGTYNNNDGFLSNDNRYVEVNSNSKASVSFYAGKRPYYAPVPAYDYMGKQSPLVNVTPPKYDKILLVRLKETEYIDCYTQGEDLLNRAEIIELV